MAGESTKVSFWQGTEANLPSEKLDGRLYYATDTKNIYLDSGTQRYQFKGTAPVTSVNGEIGDVVLGGELLGSYNATNRSLKLDVSIISPLNANNIPY